MTQEEWLSHSEQWRKGYNAYIHDEPITQDEWNDHSQEWRDGCMYAMQNPFGSCYTVNATTGRR